jgi:hypothetical protein
MLSASRRDGQRRSGLHYQLGLERAEAVTIALLFLGSGDELVPACCDRLSLNH